MGLNVMTAKVRGRVMVDGHDFHNVLESHKRAAEAQVKAETDPNARLVRRGIVIGIKDALETLDELTKD